MSSWSRSQAVFIKFLFLIDSFVQLKINNQALETAFAPVSPGEVFKVFGSDKSIKHNQHNNMFIFFTFLIMAALMIMQNQNRMAYPYYIMDIRIIPVYTIFIYLP